MGEDLIETCFEGYLLDLVVEGYLQKPLEFLKPLLMIVVG